MEIGVIRILLKLAKPFYFILKLAGYHYVIPLYFLAIFQDKFKNSFVDILAYICLFILIVFWARGRVLIIGRLFKKDFDLPGLDIIKKNKRFEYKKLDKAVFKAKEGVFFGRLKGKNIIMINQYYFY